MWADENEPKKPTHCKQLIIWQRAMLLANGVYRLTSAFPPEERNSLAAQMRRAAVSVPSNIAEGQARRGPKEFLQFLSLASGSLAELETQLLLSVDLGYLDPADLGPLETELWGDSENGGRD